MAGNLVTDQEASGDLKLAYWKPGMNKQAVIKRNIDDANFPGWMQNELVRAPKGMIFFFITATTDIF
jgi:hypothetical protein